MQKIIATLKLSIYHYPCIFLLFFVYFFFIPRVVSYDHSWAITEILYLEGTAFKTGANLNWNDLKNGLDYTRFEGKGQNRITRPWSSYFQILDAKFRAWLWHFILPHPSLSLTWIFTLFLAPILLYLLFRNLGIDTNVALGMSIFYLLTPTSLSHVTELFRLGKPMTDFVIILCLYWASSLEKKFLTQNKSIPWSKFLWFWIASAMSFYWDEAALLIFPAILFLFPKVLTHRKSYLLLWLLLPFITMVFYFLIIPYLTFLSGHALPNLSQDGWYRKGLQTDPAFLLKDLHQLPLHAKNMVLGTMGIIIPDVFQASLWIKSCFVLAITGWGIVFFYMRKILFYRFPVLIFLVGVTLVSNHLMFVLWSSAWGAFWYGGFWAVFFTIWLALLIDKSKMPKILLAGCLLFILINMFQSFIAVNTVYKRYHYYPYKMSRINEYFKGKYQFFAPENGPIFPGNTIKTYIQIYWAAHQEGLTRTQSYCLPSELHWLVLELDAGRKPPPLWRQILWKHDRKDFIDTLNASDICNAPLSPPHHPAVKNF